MPFAESLSEEHRLVDAALDRFAAAVDAGELVAVVFQELKELVSRHYGREEIYLARVQGESQTLAAKMRGQHAEAMEIASRLEESLAAGQTGDVLYLARRFLAIVRHNMIEEERDVFPLFPGL